MRGSAIPGNTGRKFFGRIPSHGSTRARGGSSAIAAQQDLLKAPGEDHGGVAHSVDAAGNCAIDLAQGNLVAQQDRRFEAGPARPLQIEPGCFEREAAAQHRFARQIPLAGVLHHRARGNIVHSPAMQTKAFNDAAQRCSQHFLITDLRVGAIAARKRYARTADNRDAPRTCSYQHNCLRFSRNLRIMDPADSI